MSRDATLDQFGADEAVDGSSAEPATTDDDGSADEDAPATDAPDDATAAPTDAAAVDPAVATYRWHPAGRPCADCGDRVERQWRVGEEWRCASCVPWGERERGATEAGDDTSD